MAAQAMPSSQRAQPEALAQRAHPGRVIDGGGDTAQELRVADNGVDARVARQGVEIDAVGRDRHRELVPQALDHGRYDNFALVSCFCAGEPAAAIATVTVHSAGEDGSEDEYLITPLFVWIVPGIRLTGHDGREP